MDLPSGEWAGHCAQSGQRFPQRMTLEFADGIVRGDGIDGLGGFTGGKGQMPQGSPPLSTLWVLTHEDPFEPPFGAIVRLAPE